MSRYALLGLIVSGAVILSGFFPVYFPIEMMNYIDEFIQALVSLDGILPMITLFSAITFVIFLEMSIFIFKISKWAVGSG